MKTNMEFESQNTEWKESWRDEYLKWICGFSNAQGGRIYIGKDDAGNIIGVKNIKKLMEDIPNKVQTTMGIIVDVNRYSENGLDYIEIIVSPSSYPVNYKGEYHYRSGSTKQLLTGNSLTQFLLKKTGLKWDAIPVDDVKLENLDKDSLEIFKREARMNERLSEADLKTSDEILLQRLGLYSEKSLKRAAVLLFHNNPEKWFTGVYTKIGKFNGAEIEYMDEVHGSLMSQAEKVIDLIFLKYLKATVTYIKDTRVEKYNYSREAIREAYFNALCHSNWSTGVPIQIKIDEKSLIISNSSIFPDNWTEKTLMEEHESIPFNPDIATAFYRAGYIESWGRGIKKICDACEKIGGEKPEYIIRGSDVMVIFKPVSIAKNPKRQNANEFGVLDGVLENKIKNALIENSNITQKELSSELNIPYRTLQRVMKTMDQNGIIQRTGGKRYGRWIVNK